MCCTFHHSVHYDRRGRMLRGTMLLGTFSEFFLTSCLKMLRPLIDILFSTWETCLHEGELTWPASAAFQHRPEGPEDIVLGCTKAVAGNCS